MLNEKEYIRLSLENNLYYSRILMEHATIILTFLNNSSSEQTKIFTEEHNQYADMNGALLTLANGKVSQDFIDSKKLVTDRTKKLEKDTMKKFNVKIDLSLTKRSMELKSGDFQVNESLIKDMNCINDKMLLLVTNTINKNKNLRDLHVLNEILLTDHFIKETEIFKRHLERIKNWVGTDPTFVYSAMYYYTELMMEHASFFNKLISKENELLRSGAEELYNQSSKIMKTFDNVVSPTTIKNISTDCMSTAGKFDIYNNKLNEMILLQSSVLNAAPIFSDHVLRETYDFLSILEAINKS